MAVCHAATALVLLPGVIATGLWPSWWQLAVLAGFGLAGLRELFQTCNLARYAPIKSSQELAAIILACVAVALFWPLFASQPFIKDEADWLGMAVFVLTSSMISGVAAAMAASQRKLKESEERRQLEVSRMPIAYIIWSKDFRVAGWNPAAEKIFGFTFAEARGRHPYDFIVPRGVQPQVDEIWRRLIAAGSIARICS